MQLAIEVPFEGEFPVLLYHALDYLLCSTLAQGHSAEGSHKINLCLTSPRPLTHENGQVDVLLVAHVPPLIAPWVQSWVEPTILAGRRKTYHYVTPSRIHWLSDRWKVDVIATSSVIGIDARHDISICSTGVNQWLQSTVFVFWFWFSSPHMHCEWLTCYECSRQS
jgi:hypothetical protein